MSTSYKKYEKYIKKQGLKGLLPQNLPENILNRMLIEADGLDSDTKETPSASFILLAILSLMNGKRLKSTMKLNIKEEVLMENFNVYIISLRVENSYRIGELEIGEDSLPTLKNIFNGHRMMNIVKNSRN